MSSGVVCLDRASRGGWSWVCSGAPLFWLYCWSWLVWFLLLRLAFECQCVAHGWVRTMVCWSPFWGFCFVVFAVSQCLTGMPFPIMECHTSKWVLMWFCILIVCWSERAWIFCLWSSTVVAALIPIAYVCCGYVVSMSADDLGAFLDIGPLFLGGWFSH